MREENNESWAKRVKEIINPKGETPREPTRLADIDVTSSFAHHTLNLTIDEVFGYKRLQKLRDMCDGAINMRPFDYDGTLPEKEKPSAKTLETTVKEKISVCRGWSDEPMVTTVSPQILVEELIPITFQRYDRERIQKEVDIDWRPRIAMSGFPKGKARDLFGGRVKTLVDIINEAAANTDNMSAFLHTARKKFLETVGVPVYGTPELTDTRMYAQKLQEDIDAGFPFWRMDAPERFRAKHMSNERTFLFWGISKERRLVPVQFFENPERFEFYSSGEKTAIPAEESPEALRKRQVLPTSTLLSYIVLGPARKQKSTDRKTRIHVGGLFMAGPQGYAREIIPYLNKTPGFDKVELVCTGYDQGGTVHDNRKTYIGFGAVFPHFGVQGLRSYLEEGTPFSVRRNTIIGEDQ